jgi:hypothetical protein
MWPGPVAAPSSSKLGLSRSQRARIGVHSNRRQPTKEDYTDYVLHQANQKVYEASFLKLFVNHALHPDQIGELPRSPMLRVQDASKFEALAGLVGDITR